MIRTYVRLSRTGRRAPEAELVAVRVAIDHLPHAVRQRLPFVGLDPARCDLLDECVEVVDPDQGVRAAGGVLVFDDEDVAMLRQLPNRLRRIRKERRLFAEQAL